MSETQENGTVIRGDLDISSSSLNRQRQQLHLTFSKEELAGKEKPYRIISMQSNDALNSIKPSELDESPMYDALFDTVNAHYPGGDPDLLSIEGVHAMEGAGAVLFVISETIPLTRTKAAGLSNESLKAFQTGLSTATPFPEGNNLGILIDEMSGHVKNPEAFKYGASTMWNGMNIIRGDLTAPAPPVIAK